MALRFQNDFECKRCWTRILAMPTSSPEMSLIDRKILVDSNNSHHQQLHSSSVSEKRKMMKTNSSSSASPTSTFELIPEESEAGETSSWI